MDRKRSGQNSKNPEISMSPPAPRRTDENCPECDRSFNTKDHCRVQVDCGHKKCRECFNKSDNCAQCNHEKQRPIKRVKRSVSSKDATVTTPYSSTSLFRPTQPQTLEATFVESTNRGSKKKSCTRANLKNQNTLREKSRQRRLASLRSACSSSGSASTSSSVTGSSSTILLQNPLIGEQQSVEVPSCSKDLPKSRIEPKTQTITSSSKLNPTQNEEILRKPPTSRPHVTFRTPERSDNDTSNKKKKKRTPLVIYGHITITTEANGKTMYRCDVCMKKFKTKAHIKYHESCQNGEKPFKCEQCGQGFIVKSHYEYHLRTHTGERPYKCPQCGKGFNQRGKVTRHMRSHTGEKPFVCQQCGRGFANAQAMRSHFLIHTGERPFACKLCNKCFTGMTNLKKHVITHTGERLFMCVHCGKSFGLKWTLGLHLKTHSSERPFACDQCTKTFTNKKDLRRHKVIHSGERPFVCEICGTAFRRKDNMDRHIRNTHNHPTPNELTDPTSSSPVAGPSTRENHKKANELTNGSVNITPEVSPTPSTSTQTPIDDTDETYILPNDQTDIPAGSLINGIGVTEPEIQVPESTVNYKVIDGFTELRTVPLSGLLEIDKSGTMISDADVNRCVGFLENYETRKKLLGSMKLAIILALLADIKFLIRDEDPPTDFYQPSGILDNVEDTVKQSDVANNKLSQEQMSKLSSTSGVYRKVQNEDKSTQRMELTSLYASILSPVQIDKRLVEKTPAELNSSEDSDVDLQQGSASVIRLAEKQEGLSGNHSPNSSDDRVEILKPEENSGSNVDAKDVTSFSDVEQRHSSPTRKHTPFSNPGDQPPYAIDQVFSPCAQDMADSSKDIQSGEYRGVPEKKDVLSECGPSDEKEDECTVQVVSIPEFILESNDDEALKLEFDSVNSLPLAVNITPPCDDDIQDINSDEDESWFDTDTDEGDCLKKLLSGTDLMEEHVKSMMNLSASEIENFQRQPTIDENTGANCLTEIEQTPRSRGKTSSANSVVTNSADKSSLQLTVDSVPVCDVDLCDSSITQVLEPISTSSLPHLALSEPANIPTEQNSQPASPDKMDESPISPLLGISECIIPMSSEEMDILMHDWPEYTIQHDEGIEETRNEIHGEYEHNMQSHENDTQNYNNPSTSTEYPQGNTQLYPTNIEQRSFHATAHLFEGCFRIVFARAETTIESGGNIILVRGEALGMVGEGSNRILVLATTSPNQVIGPGDNIDIEIAVTYSVPENTVVIDQRQQHQPSTTVEDTVSRSIMITCENGTVVIQNGVHHPENLSDGIQWSHETQILIPDHQQNDNYEDNGHQSFAAQSGQETMQQYEMDGDHSDSGTPTSSTGYHSASSSTGSHYSDDAEDDGLSG